MYTSKTKMVSTKNRIDGPKKRILKASQEMKDRERQLTNELKLKARMEE